jgi:hypothetical protein
MGNLRRYLELQLQAKSGMSSALVIGGVIGLLSAAITFVFLLIAAFVWLAERYDPLTAGLGLCIFFLLITIAMLVYSLWLRRRTIQQAELALAARRTAPWLDPKLVGEAVQLSRAIGLRKMLPLLAIGVLAAGAATQWIGRDRPDFVE